MYSLSQKPLKVLTLEELTLSKSSVVTLWRQGKGSEFLLVLQGKGFHETNRSQFPFSSQSILFFPETQKRRHRTTSASARLLSIRFEERALSREANADIQALIRLNHFKQLAILGKNELALSKATMQKVKPLLLNAWHEEQNKEAGYRCVLKGLALQFVVLLGRDRHIEFRWSANRKDHGVFRVLKHLDEAVAQPITVEAMATLAGMSRSHFQAQFKEATGLSLIDYITQLRVARASNLLEWSPMSVAEIAFECGFNSTSRFYNAFKRQYQMAPGVYRRQVLDKK